MGFFEAKTDSAEGGRWGKELDSKYLTIIIARTSI